ncbi:ATP-dependent helicase [Salinispira pacifica]|uniref:DNA 3'-5' helicase n=1 Tax=Salinispira pacifica TaxID=1307761 RepID=V5WFU7_9SPIO|nr:UvrD-helicase domain-containing protein [Salinispira pacifica]AHC14663.1 ATP-dependent DNA helicase UvrD/PcrA [Salinispira pacifica]
MSTQLKSLLNPEQYEAATNLEGPLLIIAGAGSGKTRVITYRITEMLNQGINQSSILALTFTNKAAREMAGRVKELVGRKLPQLTVSTFHSFGVQILKKHITLLGWRENFSIYDTNDQRSLIKECARELKWSLEYLDFGHCMSTFSRIKTRRSKWSDPEIDDSLQPLYEEYQSHRKLYNALDFDDLIRLPIDLFQQHPQVLEEYRKRYKYIMVDEFQDTSIQQYEMMKLLADGSRNICVVGDDDQSIYSWRGANFDNIRNFERDFPELREIKLEQNYRSTGTILDAANHLIKNNKNRKIKALWTGGDGGKPIELYQPQDERAEARFICDMIQTLNLKEQIHYHDISILIRTNALARGIEEELMARNLPYRITGGTSFFERPEVKDMISYLRCLANPDDDISLLRIMNTPRRGIGKKTLEHMTELAQSQGMSLYGAMQALVLANDSPIGKRARADIEDFLELISEFRPKLLSGKDLAQSLRALIAKIDYWGHLVGEHPNNERVAKFKLRNVELFTSSLEQWEKDPDNLSPSVFNYLNRITLAGKDDDDSEEGKVNLMTIHSAKGLEFDVVFIAGVEENIIPHQRSLEENDAGSYEENMEEERRLFYVALTRAKMKLYLTSCQQRKVMRDLMSMTMSPFIEEIPEKLIDIKEPDTEISEEEAHNYFELMKKKFAAVEE